MIKPDGV
jgi:nucleoside-diphosphate kinase